jgi:three-Cys-motif partner protein
MLANESNNSKGTKIQPLTRAASGEEHRFGGPWTEIKLDAVEYYWNCYTPPLARCGFDLWCVDAFAGSGERQIDRHIGGILTEPLRVVTETLAGSARRALSIKRPFDHYVFNEPHPDRNRALKSLCLEYPDRDIQVLQGDANAVLNEIFSHPRWMMKGRGSARGVAFLDPYAMQVDWATLELLARTQAVDVWFLFPLAAVCRQLSHRRSGIGPKEPKLDRVLDAAWRDLYQLPPPSIAAELPGLFDNAVQSEKEHQRAANQKQIEEWFKRRLQSIFPYASDALPLLTGEARQTFSLFLCVANPSTKAITLATRFHSYVMRQFGPVASRRMSGRAAGGQ